MNHHNAVIASEKNPADAIGLICISVMRLLSQCRCDMPFAIER